MQPNNSELICYSLAINVKITSFYDNFIGCNFNNLMTAGEAQFACACNQCQEVTAKDKRISKDKSSSVWFLFCDDMVTPQSISTTN